MIFPPVSRRLPVILFLLSVSLWGCSLMPPHRPSYSPQTAEILSSIDCQNQSVTAVNGLGSIMLSDNGQVTRYRLAWAAKFPDRLRMVVLFSGKPIETLIYDGRELILTSHTEAHEPIRKKTKNPNLERLTTLPLSTDELIGFLTGRIPVQPHRSAHLRHQPDGDFVLNLMKNKTTVAQTLYMDTNHRVTAYDISGKRQVRYQIHLKPQTSDNQPPLSFPDRIRIDQDDRSLTITVDNIQPNPDLPDDAFNIR